MLRRYKAILLFLASLFLLVLLSLFVKQWLLQDTWWLEGYQWIDWMHDIGHFYMNFLSTETGKHFLLGFLFPLLYTSMILTVFNIGFIAFFILFRRWRSINNYVYFSRMREKTEDVLLEYLYGDKDAAMVKLRSLNRRILVKEMVGLRKQIIGSKADQLRSLFYELHLDDFIIRKIKYSRWFNKIMYIDAAQWMLVTRAEDVIEPYQYVTNVYIRNVAQVACISLSPDSAFSFLNVLEYPLPVWHQIILYKSMVLSSVPIPDFYAYLRSDNTTVVLFALNMIRLFSQRGDEEKIIALVSHEDPIVRRNALKVICDLKIYQAMETVKQYFQKETIRNQVNMVHVLSLDKTEETLDFYKTIWIETKPNVRMEILKHIEPALRKKLQDTMPSERGFNETISNIHA
ncbi:MAG: hypothetical protein H6Q17_2798 [Bacteroidetes bacterium]|nr:hypothetical protein [Bacteroidota bacterium]